jgi:hypothetical protein
MGKARTSITSPESLSKVAPPLAPGSIPKMYIMFSFYIKNCIITKNKNGKIISLNNDKNNIKTNKQRPSAPSIFQLAIIK